MALIQALEGQQEELVQAPEEALVLLVQALEKDLVALVQALEGEQEELVQAPEVGREVAQGLEEVELVALVQLQILMKIDLE